MNFRTRKSRFKKVLKDILNYIPNSINNIRIKDPNYNLFIEDNELTDQYYDTGLSRLEWEKQKEIKRIIYLVE